MADNEGRDEFDIGGYVQDRDMNNNGIPDMQEPASRPFSSDMMGPQAYSNDHRAALAHLVGSIDVSDAGHRDHSYRRPVEAADRLASVGEQAIDAADDKLGDDSTDGRNYRNARKRIEVERLTRTKPNKSTLKSELARGRPPVAEHKTGLEIAQELLKGMAAGAKHGKQSHLERKQAKNTERARELELEHAMAEDSREAARREAGDIRARAGSPGVDPNGGGAPGGDTPGGGTPPESGPGGPGDGPGGPGGPGSPDNPGDAVAAPDGVQPGTTPEVGTPANDRDPASPAEAARDAQPGTTAEASSGTPERPSIDSVATAAERPANEAKQADDKTRSETQRGTELQRQSASDRQSVESPAVAAQSPAQDAPAQQAPSAQPGQAQPSERSSSDVDPASHTGSAAMGAAVSVVNPVAGAAATAAHTSKSQRDAGAEHRGASPSGRAPVPNGEKRIAAPEAPKSNVVEFRKPEPSRKGGLHAQAAGLDRPDRPVLSKAPSTPPTRDRTVGLGGPISRFVLNSVRAPESKGADRDGPDLMAQHYQKQRDGSGRGR